MQSYQTLATRSARAGRRYCTATKPTVHGPTPSWPVLVTHVTLAGMSRLVGLVQGAPEFPSLHSGGTPTRLYPLRTESGPAKGHDNAGAHFSPISASQTCVNRLSGK